MIATIAFRELRSMFLSPLAWAVLAVTQIILSYYFFVYVYEFMELQSTLATLHNAPGATDLIARPTLETASMILLMVTPLLSMRLISEELRSGTIALLMSSPVSMTQIVLGKFAGILMFMLAFVLIISLMPLSLLGGTELDLGKLAAGLVSLVLLLASFASVGLYISSLTSNPIVAAVSSLGLILFFWIIGGSFGQEYSSFTHLSLSSHFGSMLRGLVDTADLGFFMLFIATFLVLTIRQLDSRRLQG